MTITFPNLIDLSPQAEKIMEKRYLTTDENGVKENPGELFWRVAWAVAEAEKNYGANEEEITTWANKFYDMLASFDFLPNSPTLMNAGTNAGTLSGCYVLSIEDNMESIMKAVFDQAMIEKWGGGVGFSLSNIRPKGTPISTTQGYACGTKLVLEELSQTGKLITQGGKRDGAHMAIMSVYHPEIEEFIECKTEEGKITNFNISVGVDSNFMNAVKYDEYIHLTWPIDKRIFEKIDDEGKIHFEPDDSLDNLDDDGKFILANDIFNKIIAGAHKNGEPGMVWLDSINKDNNTPELGEIQATNPCGEQPLLGNESCNLGSINLSNFTCAFISNLEEETSIEFDINRFRKFIMTYVRFLDNVIDVNTHPTEATTVMNLQTRKIGLGVMGWADLLTKLSIPYNTQEAVDLIDTIGGMLQYEADMSSATLGNEKGSFLAFDKSSLNIKNGGEWEHMRNAWRLSIAPTGTISSLADCSSGIEPLFDIAYKRKNMSGQLEGDELYYINSQIVQKYTQDAYEYMEEGKNIRELLDEEDQKIFVTSNEIAPDWHLQHQAAWQKYIDSGISKTINLPFEATEESIKDIYIKAWELGCKGITVYRNGSREDEVLVSTVNSPIQEEVIEDMKDRPSELLGKNIRVRTGHGNMYVNIGWDENGKPFEVISNIGKAGQCVPAYMESISRLVSLCLRSGIDVEYIIDQLKGITCCPIYDNGKKIHSPADGIAYALNEFIKEESEVSVEEKLVLAKTADLTISTNGTNDFTFIATSAVTIESCVECGAGMYMMEGCSKCSECGYSKC